VNYTVTIWGARGSIPSPGLATSRYGGNTSCISVEPEHGNGRLVVLDSGSGIRTLGNALIERDGHQDIDLLLTHTHWDHIQGLPFFAPMFREGNVVRVHGARQADVDLGVILRQQMHPVVFPVPLEQTAAELTIEHILPGRLEVGGFEVEAFRLRHPGTTLGYRLTPAGGGASFAYVTDSELGPGGRYEVGPEWRAQLVRFLEGVDLLVHDAMYTPDDIAAHRGWGHSCYSEAVALALEAGVGQLWLFHHGPERTDTMLDGIVRAAEVLAHHGDHRLEVRAAAEGMQASL
jgi:phosphoribosyl 1,2-cyclic phosphodiesterase